MFCQYYLNQSQPVNQLAIEKRIYSKENDASNVVIIVMITRRWSSKSLLHISEELTIRWTQPVKSRNFSFMFSGYNDDAFERYVSLPSLCLQPALNVQEYLEYF